MKKIIIGLFLLLSILMVEKVDAQTYQLEREIFYDIFYYRNGGEVPSKQGEFAIFRMNGEIAYCIEPGKHITTNSYTTEEGYLNLPYSDDVIKKLELIGHYGSEYPGHDGVRYSMATQALIWELTGSGEVKFYTKKDRGGEEIDVTEEREEILSLVNNHDKLPNIPNDIYGYYNEEVKFIDDLLKNYYISDFGGNTGRYGEVYLQGNKLSIYSRIIGDSYLEFTKKRYDDKTTLIFIGNDTDNTQKLGRFRFSEDITFRVNLHMKGIKIKINKVDENNNPLLIPGIKFKVKDLNNNQYICENDDCTFITNNDGYAITDGLNPGIYEIEEDENQLINGYSWNNEKYEITLREDMPKFYNDLLGHFINVNFVNKKVFGKVELIKKGEFLRIIDNNIHFEYQPLSNISFDLYNIYDEYINTLITDDNGYLKCDDLPLGKYYFMENNSLNNYLVNNEKIFFEIQQINQYDNVIITNLEVLNYLKKGNVIFFKEDEDTKAGIPDTIMELYDENNKLLVTKTTDSNGKIIINDLPYGKYYFKEKEANENYKKSNEIIDFEIKDNNETQEIHLTNKRIVGSLELFKYGEKFSYNNNQIVYEKIPLKDIEFELYNDKNELIDILITNNDGYVKYNNLLLGNYYVKEKEIINGYRENDKKYKFEITKDMNNEAINVSLEVNNELLKGDLVFTKEDLLTKEGIKDTTIEIYDIKDNLLLTRKTDINGKIIIIDLPVGEYYLLEKEANASYQITNEKVDFEIKDNEESRALMYNEKKVVKVPKTDINDTLIVNKLFSMFMIFIIGNYYVKRKTS